MGSKKSWLLLIPGTMLGLMLDPHAPLGRILWPPYDGPGALQPDAAQLAAFVPLALIQALAVGLGLVVLVQGASRLRNATPSHPSAARAAHLGIVWGLVSWVPHVALHEHIGTNVWAFIAVDYAFHMSIIVAFALVARWFILVLETKNVRPVPQLEAVGVVSH